MGLEKRFGVELSPSNHGVLTLALEHFVVNLIFLPQHEAWPSMKYSYSNQGKRSEENEFWRPMNKCLKRFTAYPWYHSEQKVSSTSKWSLSPLHQDFTRHEAVSVKYDLEWQKYPLIDMAKEMLPTMLHFFSCRSWFVPWELIFYRRRGSLLAYDMSRRYHLRLESRFF